MGAPQFPARRVHWWFMGRPFRHAMCNEAFEGRSFAATCAAIRRAGYTGVEIAPFTLAEAPAQIGEAQRREYRAIMASEGLGFTGFHWLMVTPKGLHVTAPDAALRRRGWEHIRALIDLCAGLGEGGVMIFGSPQQRCATGGLTPAQAVRHFVEGLASIAPHAMRVRGNGRRGGAFQGPVRRGPVAGRGGGRGARGRQPGHWDHVRRAQRHRRDRAARRPGGPLLRTHPPCARERARRPILRHPETTTINRCSKSCDAAATRDGFRSKLSISRPARRSWPPNRCAIWNGRSPNCHV